MWPVHKILSRKGGLILEKQRRRDPGKGSSPMPSLSLLEQVSEVMRFKHYSLRTERTYQEWIKRYMA
jgi:hypothetical protein